MEVYDLLSGDQAQVRQLVLAAQAGDRSAFGELFERFHGVVMAVALRRLGRNVGDAEELVQDVFVQALQKLPQLRTPEAFAGWIKSIANRMAINRLLRRGPVVSADPSGMVDTCIDAATPECRALARERSDQVRAGLGRLGALDRETLEAFYLRDCSLQEMSHEFEAPLGTIKRRLHVARKRLSRQVEEIVAV